MHSHDQKPDIHEKQVPYATDEVTLPILAYAGMGLFILFIISLVIGGSAYYMFVIRETEKPSQVFASTPKVQDPNVPLLQKDPIAEIHKFRADEYTAERSYMHWKDGDGKDSLRIPISRAMEIVKQNGLPKAVKAEAGQAAPSTTTGSPPAGTAITPDGNPPSAGGVPSGSGGVSGQTVVPNVHGTEPPPNTEGVRP